MQITKTFRCITARCTWPVALVTLAVFSTSAVAQRSTDISEGRLIRVLRPEALGDAKHAPVITALTIHPNGRMLAAAGDDHVVRLWDIERGLRLGEHRSHADWVRSATFSDDGEDLVTAAADGKVLCWNFKARSSPRTVVSQQGALVALALCHDGDLAVLAGFNEPLQLVATSGRRSIKQIACGCDDIRTVAISTDNRYLACGGRDGSVYIWSLESNALLHSFKAHKRRINCVVFDDTCGRLISGGDDRRLCVWDCESGERLHVLPTGRAKVLSLAALDDGGVAAGCTDNTIRIWNVASGQRLTILTGHSGSVATLAAHGELLASGSYDTTIRVWNLDGLLGDIQATRSEIHTR